MESLAYTLLFLLRGDLPSEDISSGRDTIFEKIAQVREEKLPWAPGQLSAFPMSSADPWIMRVASDLMSNPTTTASVRTSKRCSNDPDAWTTELSTVLENGKWPCMLILTLLDQ
jgi:hypothetical protein